MKLHRQGHCLDHGVTEAQLVALSARRRRRGVATAAGREAIVVALVIVLVVSTEGVSPYIR